MRERLYNDLHLEYSKSFLEKQISITSQSSLIIYNDIYKNIFDHQLSEVYFTDEYYCDGFEIFEVKTDIYQSDLNIIMYQNNLIQKIVTLVVKNEQIDTFIKIKHKYNFKEYMINFSTITLFLLLLLYEKNLHYTGIVCEKNVKKIYNFKVNDIHNVQQLKNIVENGNFDKEDMNYCIQMSNPASFLRMNCLNEFKIFMESYSLDYRKQIKLILIDNIYNPIIDIVITYWTK